MLYFYDMFCQFLDTIEVQKRKIDDLMAQAAEIESLKMQLSTENEKLENNESQIQVLKTDNQGSNIMQIHVKNTDIFVCLHFTILFVYRISN